MSNIQEKDVVEKLQTMLRKFTKVQLLREVCGTMSVPRNVNPKTMDKPQTIEYVIRQAKSKNLNLNELIYELELKYCQLHQNTRQWSAMEVKNAQLLVEDTTDTEKFSKKLAKYLKRSHLLCDVISQIYKGAVWTMITIDTNGQRKDKVFLQMYPKLSVTVHSLLKAGYQSAISRCLVQLFKGSSSVSLPLKTKNVETLLVYSSEHFQVDLPARLERESREESADEEPMETVVDENQDEEIEKRLYLLDTFGSYKESPIELLSFNVVCDFEAVNSEDISITSRVVFKGKNLLEGMRELVRVGAAVPPLPEPLTHIGTRKYGNRMSMRTKP